MYLYDDNHLNDIEYLLNKDVLFEKIPYMIAQSLTVDYDEGNSYNWAQWKSFNEDMILGLYIRKMNIEDMKPENCYQDKLNGNLALLCAEIEAHPETQFKISIPPYSMLWWDNIYENVELYYFLNDREIVTNLDNYMDLLHFSPEINQYICDSMIRNDHNVTEANCHEIIEDSRSLAYQVVNELIKPYEDRIKVDIYD